GDVWGFAGSGLQNGHRGPVVPSARDEVELSSFRFSDLRFEREQRTTRLTSHPSVEASRRRFGRIQAVRFLQRSANLFLQSYCRSVFLLRCHEVTTDGGWGMISHFINEPDHWRARAEEARNLAQGA